MIHTLPEFEARQVLTSDELNWLTCYLDSQNRQTRRMLIGQGVLGGLQVRLQGNTVMLSNGLGLTSAGHIVAWQAADTDFTSFTKIKNYQLQPKEKPAYLYQVDTDINADDYSGSVLPSGIYFKDFLQPVQELLQTNSNEGQAINGATIKDKVLLLFAEMVQKELKDCEDDNCQERGKKYEFNTRVLVIHKDDARRLLAHEYGLNNPSDQSISKLAFPWLHLPNMLIMRPSFGKLSNNTAFGTSLLIQEYQRCIRDFDAQLRSNKLAYEESLQNLKNHVAGSSFGFGFIDKVLAVIAASKVMTNTPTTLAQNQLIYDFIWKICQAYHELQQESQALRAKLNPKVAAFPNHIFAGVIDVNTNFENPIGNQPQIFRHEYAGSLSQNDQGKICRKVAKFLQKLMGLAEAFDTSVLSNTAQLRLVPGGDINGALSEQAVPFYFSNSVFGTWSDTSSQNHLGKYITNYYVNNEQVAPSFTLAFQEQPAAYQGNQQFYRIEGTYGQVALNALNSVFSLRKKHGLAFEIMMLRTNEQVPFNNSFSQTVNEDLTSMYQVVRAEVMKQISLNTNYLANLQIKNNKVAGIKASLMSAMEESFLGFVFELNTNLLAQPLKMELSEAIVANNLATTAKLSINESLAPQYQELNTKLVSKQMATTSLLKTETQNLAAQKISFIAPATFFPIFVGDFVLFSNTLGSLVASIKSDNKFKNSTDLGFYNQLYKAAGSLQNSQKNQQLFLQALQIYAALKIQEQYTPNDLAELEVAKYQDNINQKLFPACVNITTTLKKLNADFVRTDEILQELIKGEMLDYADRIRFDDDWVKISQLDTENKRRNGGMGVENLLQRFLSLHPGLSHGCGVPKGGTFVMIYDQSNKVIGDFFLPYIIATNLRPIQYTLLENKALTLSGQITDATGAKINATLLIDGASILSDSTGFYNALVNENTTVTVLCKADGYELFEEKKTIKTANETLNIVLKKIAVKQTLTLNFVNQNNTKINKEFNLIEIATGKETLVAGGTLALENTPNTKIGFKIGSDLFENQQFEVIIPTAATSQTIKLTELAQLLIQIVDDSTTKYTASLFKNIKVTNPDTALDTRKLMDGVFSSIANLDINAKPTASVTYAGQTKNQVLRVGVNNLINFTLNQEAGLVAVPTRVQIFYPIVAGAQFPKLTSININKISFAIDPTVNMGQGEIKTNGRVELDKRLINPTSFEIGELDKIKNAIFVFDASVIAQKNDIAVENLLLSTTREFTVTQIAAIERLIPGFKDLANTSLNFYCLVVNKVIAERLRRLL